MLGTLATWLRILGYDTAYSPKWDDNELARRSRAQGRVLLTRDVELSRRPGLSVLLIEAEGLEAQLVQVLNCFDLTPDQAFSRCPVCNVPLCDIPKREAWNHVPSYVYATQSVFRLCPECGRVFWRGTHWQDMLNRLQDLRTD